jgi:hypothetical protein
MGAEGDGLPPADRGPPLLSDRPGHQPSHAVSQAGRGMESLVVRQLMGLPSRRTRPARPPPPVVPGS